MVKEEYANELEVVDLNEGEVIEVVLIKNGKISKKFYKKNLCIDDSGSNWKIFF